MLRPQMPLGRLVPPAGGGRLGQVADESGAGQQRVRAKDALGAYGERVAAAHLVAAGMTVLDRNWRCPIGEIDIVARDGDVLVVCEVKTRSSVAFGHPAEAVDWRKQRELVRSATVWIDRHGRPNESYRFDVIGVLVDGNSVRVKHVENAFLPGSKP